MRFIGLFIVLFFIGFTSNAQDTADSLLFAYENQTGIEKMETVFRLSEYYSNDDLFKSLDYGKEGLAMANEFGDINDVLNANNQMGIIYYKLGELSKSNEYFLEAVRISANRKNPDLNVESRIMNNIANNYGDQKQEKLAIEYYKKAMDIKRKLKDSSSYSMTLNNMAITYGQMHAYDSAYMALRVALSIDEALNDSLSIAYTRSSMGEIFLEDGKVDSAVMYLEQSLEYFNRIQDNDYVLAYYYSKIGKAELLHGNYLKAEEYFRTSLQLSKTIGAKAIVRDSYKGLSEVAENSGKFKEALEYGKLHSQLQDSLYQLESAQKLSAIETSYQIKNREQEISILSANAEVDKLKFYSATGTAIVVMALLGLLYYRYQFKTKANLILKQKNETIQMQNKEIMDSVEYAKGIQEAILPNTDALSSAFNKAYLYYKPSKVVSGDFYWVDSIGSKVILVVADGTGHGVPGAFLSVLGTGLLRQIISEEQICQPDQILVRLNEKVKEGLGQSNLDNTLKDGMDVAVCVWDKTLNELAFAGAKRPLLLKQNNKVVHTKGNRFSIGGDQKKNPVFKVHNFKVHKGDSIVLLTDGVIDQFGGTENKKFLLKRLVELYEKEPGIAALENSLDHVMESWISKNEQLDDMLLLAVEI